MREIKFRAWDGEEMTYDRKVLVWTNSPPYTELNPLFDFEMKKILFLQYTGLKDKNGKEIYEGDILEGTANNFRISNWKVYWNKDMGKWGIESRIKIGLTFKISQKLKLVGNIYENPELLKKDE